MSEPDAALVPFVMEGQTGEPPLGAGESSSVPGTAAIANAIFDATGVRFCEPPFTPEKIRAALNPLPAPVAAPPQRAVGSHSPTRPGRTAAGCGQQPARWPPVCRASPLA